MPKKPPMNDEEADVVNSAYAAHYEARSSRRRAEQLLAESVLVAYDAGDRHISDSDLDDEQPVSLLVRTTLGEIRSFRRVLAERSRGAVLVAADLKARDDYERNL